MTHLAAIATDMRLLRKTESSGESANLTSNGSLQFPLQVAWSVCFLISLLFFVSSEMLSSPIPLFSPPPRWESVLPDQLSPCIQIGFLGKGSTPFRPSMNLALEEVDVDLKSYLKAVKEIHLRERGTTWRDLGKFMTHVGEGRLTEIGTTSLLGPVKMLQMIVIVNQTAYILTGATIKDDFLRFQGDFIKSFQSFHLINDLFSFLPSDKRERFELFFAKIDSPTEDAAEREAQWMELQKMIVQEGQDMGDYWPILVLQEARQKIYR